MLVQIQVFTQQHLLLLYKMWLTFKIFVFSSASVILILLLVFSSRFSIYKSMLSPIDFDFFLSILKTVFCFFLFFLLKKNRILNNRILTNSILLRECSGCRTASMMLSQSVQQTSSCCSQSQRESFQFFIIKYDVSCGSFTGAL